MKTHLRIAVAGVSLLLSSLAAAQADEHTSGWLQWRGPQQTGASRETNLPETWEVDGKNHRWTKELSGRGTPVIVGDRVYAWGYRGEEEKLREWLVCMDANTGKTHWEIPFSDFLSDIIYDRYAIGAPTVDPETGNIFLQTTARELVSVTPDGKIRWRHSLMESFGAGTYPNGRTGAPVIDGDRVIVNVISTNWGSEGPPRNRFYAFNKKTGEPMWSATPGIGPPYLKDSCFSTPVLAYDNKDRRVFYSGIGSGAIVCVNAMTGESIWRVQLAVGGINSSVVLHGDKVIGVHGVQGLKGRQIGAMLAIDRTAEPKEDGTLGDDAILWKNELEAFSSSPVLVGDRAYVTVRTGELACVNVNNGEILWQKKLAPDQIHASPLYADGKLYVPMNNGLFYILKPTDEKCEVLTKIQLDGNCLGAPSVYNGKVYVFTTNKLYCFGFEDNKKHLPEPLAAEKAPQPGPVAQLQVTPSEVLMQPNQAVGFTLTAQDARGHHIGPVTKARLEKWIPPKAKVKVKLDAEFNVHNELVAGEDAALSAGAIRATALELPAKPASLESQPSGTARGRIMPSVPFGENFDEFKLAERTDKGDAFAYPPLPWIGARFKWDVREVEGSNVLRKTLDNMILQRAITFIGHPDQREYTITADVMTDGNRRMASDVGLINQRYLVVLRGNAGQIELSSNFERLHVNKPFPVKTGQWYTLKVRVEPNVDGTSASLIQVKVWPRGEDEPDAWNLEHKHEHGHGQGSPGLFGFAPQNLHSVFIDNIKVTPNGKSS